MRRNISPNRIIAQIVAAGNREGAVRGEEGKRLSASPTPCKEGRGEGAKIPPVSRFSCRGGAGPIFSPAWQAGQGGGAAPQRPFPPFPTAGGRPLFRFGVPFSREQVGMSPRRGRPTPGPPFFSARALPDGGHPKGELSRGPVPSPVLPSHSHTGALSTSPPKKKGQTGCIPACLFLGKVYRSTSPSSR